MQTAKVSALFVYPDNIDISNSLLLGSHSVSNRSIKKNKTTRKDVNIDEEINHTSFEFQAAAISKLIASTGQLSNSLLQN